MLSDMEKKEQRNLLVQISNVEKRLWATIHAKGLLHHDVQNLYQKLCSSYEKILIGDHELTQLQDVEYSLWKIHYNQIDEFRKILKKSPVGEMTKKHQKLAITQGNIENYAQGLKSFLTEATKFYKRLVVEIRRSYGLPEDFSFCGSDGTPASIEPRRMEKLQILSHRFLICLGDLARYKEQCERDDAETHDWSVAVSYYLEASTIWPHSGNPQNQLAVLATYVGDEFLALYHCLRSLAVKEPFPDAWNNLVLLFERNRSVNLSSVLTDARFDSLNPHERFVQIESSSDNGLSKTDCDGLEEELWPLLIRLISFFFTDCRFEEFSTTFASTLKQLDALLSLDDAKLKVALEPYQRIDSARTGPYRALHVVSIFIFVIDRLIGDAEMDESKKNGDANRTVLLEKALTASLVFMRRIVDRCLNARVLHASPLLPALLVFGEWLPNILDEATTYEADDKSKTAMSYFLTSFLDLLKQLEVNRENEEEPSGSIALWEDYELRGFQPLAHSHSSLDFSSHSDLADSFNTGAHYRARRIINAAMKIADRPSRIGKWILYDKFARKFYAAEVSTDKKQSDEVESTGTLLEMKESGRPNSVPASHKSSKEDEVVTKEPSNHLVAKYGSVDEEEVILFNPLTRHNSAPVSSIRSNDQTLQTSTDEQTLPADERLRRATSLLIAQNQGSLLDSSAVQYGLTNFRHSGTVTRQESTAASISPSTSISAGPPSFNAWVLDGGNGSNDTTKGANKVSGHTLTPIDETRPSFSDLDIGETRDSIATTQSEVASTTRYSSPTYAAPVPSAPSLPDNAPWLNGIQSTSSSDYNSSGMMINATQASGYSNWSGSHQPCNPTIPTHTNVYLPWRPLTSSEWLRQYRQNYNHPHTANHLWPIQPTTESNGSFYINDISRTGFLDQWGATWATNPQIYEQYPTMHMVYPPVTDGCNRLMSYGDERDPRPLLHFLKEKECLLQQNPGPSYMGR